MPGAGGHDAAPHEKIVERGELGDCGAWDEARRSKDAKVPRRRSVCIVGKVRKPAEDDEQEVCGVESVRYHSLT